ncbi:efflux RND transporter periplasmic adaptor subunit [Lysobacter sp. 5GHs7-4]|uniref:efflux RND transporter periplasmic adaptor subunit n=1 Tax=Lysobacter sp. 5GHs7-4 TaxID=2904253 RepID=UPI001E56F955|nr:efflux RND transporter periplasmic adaptor subunit [Lysobacter sp. 5GHs7-4]UHQ21435.1 efflux RND transporter periplasmic adaptor subunit [Lysobacter sp. 5GHs7-4]
MRARPPRWLLVFLVCSLLAACGGTKEEEGKANDASAMAVSLVAARPQPLARSVLVSGPVSAFEEMQLGVELSGQRVTALRVDVGQAVSKGQVLLQLDHRTLDSELAQAEASLRQAQASLSLAQVSYDRGAKLAAEQLISAGNLDELRATRVQAEAQVATARAGRDAAQLRRDFAELRAPAAGVISKRLVQPGQVVSAGSELLRLIRDGRLEWRAELPEDQLAGVAVGNTVELPYSGSTVVGRIRAVTPGVDAQTRTGTVYVDLPDPGALRPGVYVEGRIVTGDGRALMVPSSAVVQRDGHSYVFTMKDQHVVERKRVRTGQTAKGLVEIVEGLKDGDQVVAEGAGFLGDGDRVRVVPAAAAKAGAR